MSIAVAQENQVSFELGWTWLSNQEPQHRLQVYVITKGALESICQCMSEDERELQSTQDGLQQAYSLVHLLA